MDKEKLRKELEEIDKEISKKREAIHKSPEYKSLENKEQYLWRKHKENKGKNN